MENIQKKSVLKLIQDNPCENLYFIAESELLCDYEVEKRFDENNDGFPVEREDAQYWIEQIDWRIDSAWILEDTQFDQNKKDGALLLRLNKDSPLPQHYIQYWTQHRIGIFIQSDADIDEMQQHLSSLVLVNSETDNMVYFRLQEPRQLDGIIKSLNKYRQAELLGPINHIIWCKDIGREYQWMHTENPNPTPASEQEAPWFSFTQAEDERMDYYTEENFKLSVLSHLKYCLTQQQDTPSPLNDQDDQALMEQIEQGLSVASQYGYIDNAHISRFILAILGNLVLTQQHADMIRKAQNPAIHPNRRINELEQSIKKLGGSIDECKN
ncbi:MAG: DUF4123 domain-containing protein [Cocleimonas sp.]|nr:DUF4123 domain-containing protein [Cocleimonas sp.]